MVVEMVDKKGPSFPEPLKTPDDEQYKRIMQKQVDVKAELDYVYKAITLTRHKLKGRVPLLGFCGAPWTLLCYMVEGGGSKLFIQSKTWIYKYPEESKALLQKIADICVEYLAFQVAAGAQMIQVFDSWAGELSPASFKSFALPYLRHISENLPKRLKEMNLEPVPMTVFAKGAWYALEELCDSGYDVVGLDWQHDPAKAVEIAKGRVTLQGNADPGVLYGGRAAITAVVEEMVRGFGGGKRGWIANLGHGRGYLTHAKSAMKPKLTLVSRNHAVRGSGRSEVLLRGDPPADRLMMCSTMENILIKPRRQKVHTFCTINGWFASNAHADNTASIVRCNHTAGEVMIDLDRNILIPATEVDVVSDVFQKRKSIEDLKQTSKGMINAYQRSGFSRMNFSISCLHSSLSRTTTSTPRSFKYCSPPTKFLFSPMTTRFTL